MLSDEQLPRRNAWWKRDFLLTTQDSTAVVISIVLNAHSMDLTEGLAGLLHSRPDVGSSMLEALNLLFLACNDFLQALGGMQHSCISLHTHAIGV